MSCPVWKATLEVIFRLVRKLIGVAEVVLWLANERASLRSRKSSMDGLDTGVTLGRICLRITDTSVWNGQSGDFNDATTVNI